MIATACNDLDMSEGRDAMNSGVPLDTGHGTPARGLRLRARNPQDTVHAISTY